MDKDFVIQLTSNLYRITLLFPKKDPLRNKMRELGSEILANLILIIERDVNGDINKECQEALEKIKILESFFEIAKSQNWLSPFDILTIQNEYSNLRNELAGEAEVSGVASLQSCPQGEKPGGKPGGKPSEMLAEGFREKLFGIGNIFSPQLVSEKSIPENDNFCSPQRMRQGKIMGLLREKGKAQVCEIKRLFPDVSKRTIRRDFEQLVEKKVLDRIGEKNATFYKIREA